MSKLPLVSIFKILFEKSSSRRFLIGTIGSFAFSIAVILSTVGLMDGFELTLKKSLRFANGDIKVKSYDSFYFENDINPILDQPFIKSYSNILQTEAFAIGNDIAKGVLVKGINVQRFSETTGIDLPALSNQEIIIGSVLAQKTNVKIGDELVLTFATQNRVAQGNTIVNTYKVKEIISNGIYEKDLRFVYLNKQGLNTLLSYKEGLSNSSYIKLNDFENINDSILKLKNLGTEYTFDPYWEEFDTLLEAVEVEKYSISLVFQLIVVISVLNIVAFIIYISEMKSQDFFMLRALGLNLKSYQKFWYLLLLMIWFVSASISVVLVKIFDQVILKLPFLKIPGDVYVISNLSISLELLDYLQVFGLSLVWVLFIGVVAMRRLKKKSLVSGLREEFS